MEGVTGEFKPVYINCVAVRCGPEAAEAAVTMASNKHEHADHVRECVEKLPGLYWKIGEDAKGYGVFRQEPAAIDDATHTEQLYLYHGSHGGEGWYYVDKLLPASDVNIFGYSQTLIGTSVSVPYWSKPNKSVKGIDCVAQHDHIAILFGKVCAKLEAKVDLEIRGARATEHTQKGAGGWFNKLVAFIKAYEQRDWDGCERIMDEARCSDLYQRVEAAKDKKRRKK